MAQDRFLQQKRALHREETSVIGAPWPRLDEVDVGLEVEEAQQAAEVEGVDVGVAFAMRALRLKLSRRDRFCTALKGRWWLN